MRGEPVTVVTITRGRPQLLSRAIASVQAQDHDGPLLHAIVVDDEPMVYAATYCRWGHGAPWRGLSWTVADRDPGDRSGPGLLGRLRNRAVRAATTPALAFLDDDNEFEPHHISSLVACMRQTGCPAVHSQRRLYWRGGTPYVDPVMPWKRDPAEGRRVYAGLHRRGLFVHGSNVVRDRADPAGSPDPARMVDTSEWLFERDLLLRLPFCEEYDHRDWVEVVPEDNKLLRALVDQGIPLACTHMPSLRYYLGGYSNSFAGVERGGTLTWLPDPEG
jgi:glycosyltransferase involved in cell wall biosynthesis